MEPGLGWAALVLLFGASLLTVAAWLLQLARGWRRGRARGGGGGGGGGGGLWAALLLRLAPASASARREGGWPGGARGLLAALFAFRAFRESWRRAWLRALNRQARRHGSSIQITFEEGPQLPPSVNISHVSCADQTDCSMVLCCSLSADTMQFPVSVTQQSPAAVSMDSYYITLAVLKAQLAIHLEEVQDEGLLVSWAFKDRPDLNLTVAPKFQLQKDSDGKVDLSTIKDLVEDAIVSTQPAMMVNLEACVASGKVGKMGHPSCVSLLSNNGGKGTGNMPTSWNKRSQGSPSTAAATPRLLLQHLRALHLDTEEAAGSRQLCCMAEVDSPRQQKRTTAVPAGSPSFAAHIEWADKLLLELGPGSRALTLSVLESNSTGQETLLGFATIPLDSPSKELRGQQQYLLNPGAGKKLSPAAAVVVELLVQELPELQTPSALRSSITPTKKIEMDRTIMPDGTIVTTVTTVQSRPKMDCKLDSPSRSPSKVEVTEKVTTMLPESDCPSSASPSSSRSSHVSNGLDPVAETAIRQLTEATNRPVKKTPTKRSTLIISGVSKVPIALDEMALSLGYAASLEATLHEDSDTAGLLDHTQNSAEQEASYATHRASQELDETTHSDISDRPSVEDAESETGSTGALETRSLKDHKVNFLRSGTKLIFRRKNKQKEAGLSQSHDDLPNAGTTSAPRKKSGSFSRRLIKRFSFKSKPKANGSTLATDKH